MAEIEKKNDFWVWVGRVAVVVTLLIAIFNYFDIRMNKLDAYVSSEKYILPDTVEYKYKNYEKHVEAFGDYAMQLSDTFGITGNVISHKLRDTIRRMPSYYSEFMYFETHTHIKLENTGNSVLKDAIWISGEEMYYQYKDNGVILHGISKGKLKLGNIEGNEIIEIDAWSISDPKYVFDYENGSASVHEERRMFGVIASVGYFFYTVFQGLKFLGVWPILFVIFYISISLFQNFKKFEEKKNSNS